MNINTNNCYHCGDDYGNRIIDFDEKNFCCNGCRTVYELFFTNDLSYYYDLQSAVGATPKEVEGKNKFLDKAAIIEKLKLKCLYQNIFAQLHLCNNI